MIKFNLNWLNIGTALFLITYINLTIFITHICQPRLLINIKKLLNKITNNYLSKILNNITSDMIISLYWFYFYLIGMCLILFIISAFLVVYGKGHPTRVSEILGWLISLIIHQFNIMLIIFMINKPIFNEINYINITIFIIFTYIYLNSYNTSKSTVDE